MYRSTFFLTSALPGGEWSASRPGLHWIGGWVDPRAGLHDVKKRKLLTLPGSNSDHSVVQPVASRYTDYAIPAHDGQSPKPNNPDSEPFRMYLIIMFRGVTFTQKV
jgi:hypothetical protein